MFRLRSLRYAASRAGGGGAPVYGAEGAHGRRDQGVDSRFSELERRLVNLERQRSKNRGASTSAGSPSPTPTLTPRASSRHRAPSPRRSPPPGNLGENTTGWRPALRRPGGISTGRTTLPLTPQPPWIRNDPGARQTDPLARADPWETWRTDPTRPYVYTPRPSPPAPQGNQGLQPSNSLRLHDWSPFGSAGRQVPPATIERIWTTLADTLSPEIKRALTLLPPRVANYQAVIEVEGIALGRAKEALSTAIRQTRVQIHGTPVTVAVLPTPERRRRYAQYRESLDRLEQMTQADPHLPKEAWVSCGDTPQNPRDSQFGGSRGTKFRWLGLALGSIDCARAPACSPKEGADEFRTHGGQRASCRKHNTASSAEPAKDTTGYTGDSYQRGAGSPPPTRRTGGRW